MSQEYRGTPVASSSIGMAGPYVYLQPGQFEARWGGRCADCGDFIRKGDAAGFNDSDEVVCDDCWIPWSDR
ncbi:hypothetical protein Adu01nite_86400 [Paractinoplanes durhamensis]|uniref:Uncharacterized protein n=1 Tax=Paractinoplanes durhamensis TaxID=113563 RepID=A0ABQ3ZBU5_9ACTN|nr:hypothetical protein Adu01nite_86400 [Actinoplanes durhamensis]